MTNILGLGDAKGLMSETSSDKLHGNGFNKLPAGYEYAPAPREASISPLPANEATCAILNNYNLLKSVIALGQALYGIMTLYQAPRDQISQYGYVAFSLTVAPYATMSVVNLIAALFCPDYLETYLVETSILVEARSRGGKFNGVVGRLEEEAEATIEPWEDDATFLAVREVGFRKGTGKTSAGNLQVDLTTTQSKAQQSESQTMGPVKEAQASALESSPGAKKEPETLNHSTTFEVRESRTGFDFNELKTPIILIPACSPFKVSSSDATPTPTPTPTQYFIQGASWKQLSLSWDVDFENSLGNNTLRGHLGFLLTLFAAGIPFSIIGGLSHGFQYGKSTFAQRAWITSWLSVGQGYFIVAVIFNMLLYPLSRCVPARTMRLISEAMRILLMGVTSVGGFVVVGQMLKSYGTCVAIPS
jgi:hypothetical protein